MVIAMMMILHNEMNIRLMALAIYYSPCIMHHDDSLFGGPLNPTSIRK